MSADAKTLAVYAARATEYAQKAAGQDYPDLNAFVARLPIGGAVLDLGCGPGLDAAKMARAGLKVTAWDASAEMIALTTAHPGVIAIQAQFEDLRAQHIFDGIWANFSLLHAPKAKMPAHLAAIHRALTPGGLFSLTLKRGKGEKRDHLGRYYALYEEPEIRNLLTCAGFTVETLRHGAGKGLAGTTDPFFRVTCHA